MSQTTLICRVPQRLVPPRRAPLSARRRGTRRAGFTLMEVLLVLAILVVLAALVVGNYDAIFGGAKEDTTMTQMKILDDQLQKYRLDMGNYPETLEDLVVEPATQSTQVGMSSKSRWRGPYLDGGQIPNDGWGTPFEIRFDEAGKPFIYSYGEDMIDGTEDDLSTQ